MSASSTAATATATGLPPLTRFMVALMALATGLVVASNYYAQPLLHTIGQAFGVSNAAAGTIVTVAQLSYAAGLLLLVPLGDRLERRALICGMTLVSAAGLLVTANATSLAMVLLGTAMTGFVSVVAQILVPFAATWAAPEVRGKTVGTIMSGLLLGILLGRTVAGGLAEIGSWRTVYWVAAALLVIMAALLWRRLPVNRERSTLSYPRLVGSVFTLFVEEPHFRTRALLGASVFASFSMLWTSLTFLLAGPAYGFSDGTIGLFGLAGAMGAVAAGRFGVFVDRGWGNRSTAAALALLVVSWGVLFAAEHTIAALIAGILILDLAVQGVHITNQSAIYRLRPEARSRLTSGYMTAYFIGGAAGSLASAAAFAHWGWHGVTAIGVALSALTLAYAAASRHARIR